MPRNSRERANDNSRNARQTAQEGSDAMRRRAQEAHNGIVNGAQQGHNAFQNNADRSVLGSGQSSIKKNPTDMAASGETTMVSLYTVATVLGSLAAAALLGRRGRGNS